MAEIAFFFCPVYTFFTSKCLYQHIAYHYILGTVKHTHHAKQNFRSTKNYKITDWHDRLFSEINTVQWSKPKTSCRFCGDFSSTSFLYCYNPIKIIYLSFLVFLKILILQWFLHSEDRCVQWCGHQLK